MPAHLHRHPLGDPGRALRPSGKAGRSMRSRPGEIYREHVPGRSTDAELVGVPSWTRSMPTGSTGGGDAASPTVQVAMKER
jgi:hypothetical protein